MLHASIIARQQQTEIERQPQQREHIPGVENQSALGIVASGSGRGSSTHTHFTRREDDYDSENDTKPATDGTT